MNGLFQTLIFSVFISTSSFAQTKLESAMVEFSAQDRTDAMYSVSAVTTHDFIGEAGQGNLTQVTGSGTFIKSNVPAVHGGGHVRT